MADSYVSTTPTAVITSPAVPVIDLMEASVALGSALADIVVVYGPNMADDELYFAYTVIDPEPEGSPT